jgi:hypothetical protein
MELSIEIWSYEKDLTTTHFPMTSEIFSGNSRSD